MSIDTELADYVKVVDWGSDVVAKVELTNSTLDLSLLVDDKSDALVTLDVVHNVVHSGYYYTSTYVNLAVGNNATVDIRLVIGAKELHFVSEVKAGGFATIDFYENATLSGGTSLNTVNHYRGAGDNNADYDVYHTPVVTAVGNLLLTKIIASGSTPQTRIGGELRQVDEFVLSPGATYLLRVTNRSGAAVPVGVIMSGYER